MKLPQLLSQYLYQTRKLDLPGIGSFTLDPEVVIPQESDRIGQMPATGIHFRNASIGTADDGLVEFIKEHTKKMKSLASADLDFYLTTGRQLLNIGKPFYIEGIGTLLKGNDGLLAFTPGEYMIARLEEAGPEKRNAYDEPPRDREPRRNPSVSQGVLLLVILIGIAAVAWGGYYFYKRNSFSEPAAEKQAVVLPDTTAAKDSNATASRRPADTANGQNNASAPASSAVTPTTPAASAPSTAASTASPTASTPSPTASTPAPTAVAPASQTAELPSPGTTVYRFVILSTDNKHHALRRYNQLLGYQLNIKMDQKDSAWFKLYFPIAALPKDTTYIKDSLSDTYAAPHIIIER